MNYKVVIFLTVFLLLFISDYKSDSTFAVGSEMEATGNGAVVSFVSDDLSRNDWSFRDIFKANQVAYTIPTVVKNVGSEVSQANLLKLQNDYGYEIASHGVDHTDMTLQSAEGLVYQLEGSKTQLRNMGFKCNNFFIPFGKYNDTVLNQAFTYYRAVRTSESAVNKQPFNLQHIKGYWIDVITLDQAKERVDTALAENAWLVLSFHTNSKGLDFINNYVVPLINYIKSKNIPILTFDKALDYYGVPPLDDFNPIPPDTEKPVITGIADLAIDVNTAFDPLNSVTATDNRDGNITSRITVTGVIDITKGGIYTVTYSVSDMAGNTVSVQRKITVIDHSTPEPQPLHELPNGIKDEISGYTVIRRVGVVTFNGTEDWQRYAVGAYAAQSVSLAFKFLFPDAFELADNGTIYLSSSNISVFLLMR